MSELVFLKLGGSLITDKTRRYTPRLEKLRDLAAEIRSAIARTRRDLRLLVGHGSGSFGHFAVAEHLEPHAFPPVGEAGTAARAAYWEGFSEVRFQASELNRHVMAALHQAGISAISLPPSAARGDHEWRTDSLGPHCTQGGARSGFIAGHLWRYRVRCRARWQCAVD